MVNENVYDKAFYERKWEDQWNFSREYFGPGFFHRWRLVQKLIKNKSLKGKILEVGCGDGSLLSIFKSYTNRLYACDISEKAIQIAKIKFGDIADFTVGDLANPDLFKDEKFDVILCCEVLEHLKDDENVMKNLYSRLSPGGSLIISVPHIKKYWTQMDIFSGHIRRYEKDELENKLEKNGFQIYESWTWGYPLFHIYNKLILRNTQKNTMNTIVQKKNFKKILSIILRSIFYFDDLFISTTRGRTIYLLAKKPYNIGYKYKNNN